MFKSNIFLDAVFFRFSHSKSSSMSLTYGPNVMLHNYIISVLNILIYVSIDKNSSAIAIGFTIELLQLVIARIQNITSKLILKYLTIICSIFKKLFNIKFNKFSTENL